ncbi:sensor histidine kinase [Exiguobacterium oxidotolerans]|uniref:sensor histidine kinase n=1 Tax=Exiguobacterium oxidotolerans TaxID=223958 RepID=UPI000494D17B|nr:HAMP domain-containing sensor histidine kinase [Exiguobacterium oxidotolerans]
MRRFKLTVWMTIMLILAAVLSTTLAWLIASQIPLGAKTVPRYYYPTEQDIAQRVGQDIKRYESGAQPTGDYEWAIYRADGRLLTASPDFPQSMTPSRLLDVQTLTEREPGDRPEVRTLHYMTAVDVGDETPGYFLSLETVKPRLNEYQVGNPVMFFVVQLILFIVFILLLTRWIAHLFKQLELRLKRLTTTVPETAPEPLAGPREFRAFAQSIDTVGDELMLLRKREQERFTQQIHLITSLSHDLRTPLTSIQGFIQWLSEHNQTLSDSERAEFLSIVSRQSETLAARIDELFALAKLSNKEYPVHLEPVDFVTLLHQVASQHPDTSYRYEGPEQLVLQVDPQLIVRLIENLIRNAELHGTGQLLFHIVRQPDHMLFSCSNAIDHALTTDQLEAFETPFVNSDVSRSNGGSGIGLSIVKQIVARHSGTFRLDSQDGRFIVTLQFPIH